MNNLPSRPAQALVHDPAEPGYRAETQYQVQDETSFINLGEIIGALRRNIWLIGVLAAIGVGVAAYLTSREVQKYTANAIIRLVDHSSGAATPILSSSSSSQQSHGGSSSSSSKSKPVASDPIQAELLVLTGRTVLGRAVDSLGLRLFQREAQVPASFVDKVEVTLPPDSTGVITLRFGEDEVSYGSGDHRRSIAYGKPLAFEGVRFVIPERPTMTSTTLVVRTKDRTIDIVKGMLEALPDQSTGGISVTVTSTDKKIAPRVVNGIVEAHKAVNAETARENVHRRRVFLEGQLRRTDSLLMIAQGDLSAFRSEEQAYSTESRFTAEQSNLIQLEIEQAKLRGDLRMFESLVREIEQSRSSGQDANLSMLMAWPGISSDPNVSSLHAQLVGYTTARDTMLVGPAARAPTHPEVQRLNALIASTEEQLMNAARTHISSIRAQVATLGSLQGRSVAKMSELPQTEPREMFLTQNLEALQQSGDQLREQYQEVRLEEAGEAGQVEIVQPATRALPEKKNPWMKMLLGLMAGVMLGSGVAFVRERLDQSISRVEEIEKILMVPNLAVIPETSSYLLESSTNGHEPRNAQDPPGVEAYRVLRTNLQFSQGDLKTLVVTSATPGEGKTLTAANLAAACARQGRHVLLMECDLRRPTMARYFEGRGEIDLSDVLLQGRPWQDAIRRSGVPGLDILLANRAFPRAAEFLAGADMQRLLAELSAAYDLVILDTTPLLMAADAALLGAIVDGVLLVVRTTHTDRGAVQAAVNQLALVGAHVVGTVLNDPAGTVGRSGHYYYDYGYSYEAECQDDHLS